jgi:class 3 adenylate cyclase/tetratricopeptide (TPR) repeat protein
MTCSRCGEDNPSGTRFCMDCGANLALVCTKCRTELPPGAAFCFVCGQKVAAASAATSTATRLASTPRHLAERILRSKASLEGERKQVTVLFADLKSSMELLADRDPEEAQRILDPVLELMMAAVHHYEGTVNQVMGDGIMALFGAPLAHEDHAVRGCYAALRMQESMARHADEARRAHGVNMQIRIGLNSGEVVVRAIGSDLRIDYTAVGQTTHLGARMEQLASPGSILLTASTLEIVEGFVAVKPLGRVPLKGLAEAVEVYELTGAGPARTRLQAAAGRGLTRFVGRSAELEQLRRAQQLVAEGHGQVAAVVGEAGVGKSRLVYEFIHSHRLQGWLVLEATSVSYGKATSYLPLVDLLKGYFKIQDGEDMREIRERVMGKLLALDEFLKPALPALLALLDVPVEDAAWQALDPSQRRPRTLDAVKRLLLREAREQPLLLVFEDLHWIDAETQAVLDTLVDSLSAAPVLLLVNYRPEFQHLWGNKTYYSQMRLGALPPESAVELLDELLGDDPGLAPLKRLLIKRGNPFFLEETVRTLAETQALVGERRRYRLAQPIQGIQIPPTVQVMLAARIDRLAPEDKRLLQTASVIGKDVPFTLLQAVAGVDDDALRGALERLQMAEFLDETGLYPDLEFSFKHALTYEVTYGGLLHERRREVHGSIVDAIERLYQNRLGEEIERLAHHAYSAERWTQALTYLRQAASRALARSAYKESAALCRKALVALGHLPSEPSTVIQGVDVRLELRTALLALGDNEQIRDLLHEAEHFAASAGDASRLAWIQGYRCMSYWGLGELEQAHVAGEQALAGARQLSDDALQVLARLGLGWTFHGRGQYRQSLEQLSSVLVTLDRGSRGPTIDSVMARSWVAACHMELGEFDTAQAAGREAHVLATGLGQPWGLAAAHYALGVLFLRLEKLSDASVELQLGLELCKEYEIWNWFTGLASALGLVWALTGQPEPGCRLLQQAVERAETMRSVFRQSLRVAWLAEAEWLAGRRDSADACADRALGLADKHGERGHRVHILRLLGDLALEKGDRRARSYFESSIDEAEQLGMRPAQAAGHFRLGRVRAFQGDLEGARDSLSGAVALFDAMKMPSSAARARAALEDLTR